MTSSSSESSLLGTVLLESPVPHLLVDLNTDTVVRVNQAAESRYDIKTDRDSDPSVDELFNFKDFADWDDIKKHYSAERTFRKILPLNDSSGDQLLVEFRMEFLSIHDRNILHLIHMRNVNSDSATTRNPETTHGADLPLNTSSDYPGALDYPDNLDRALTAEYETLIANVPGVVYRCNYDSDWTMQFISNSIEDISGYSREEFINNSVRSYASIIHPEDRTKVERDIRKSINNHEMFEIEYRIVDSEDRVHWVLERGQGVRNTADEVICLEGVILDITERKLALKDLEKNERRYRSVFENAEIGMAEISFDERWLSVNSRLEELLGYNEEKLVQMKCREITHPRHIEKDERCTRKVMEGEQDYYVTDKQYQRKNGEYVWVRMTVSRVDIPRGDHDGYFIAIIEDIDERKQYERQLEELVDEKETLIKEIHHRVKNNLQMMISLLDMQSREASTEEAHDFLRESAGRIRSMALLHEMLYQEDQITEIDLNEYVESLVSYIRRAHRKEAEDVKLKLHIDAAELQIDRAIPSGLILNELIANAFEHGNRDGTLSTVEVRFSVDNGTAHLEVEDDGVGFPDGFEPESSESLGLKLVKTLAEHELAGTLTLENDGGARARVTFGL